MTLTFNEFFKKHNLRNKATSNTEIQQVLSFLSLNDVGIYLRTDLLNLMLVLSIYIHQKGRIGFVIYMEILLILMAVFVKRNYLNLS